MFVETNPREFGRAKGFADRTTDILTFYASLLGDAPYNSFTLAITESDLPGGHSPAYFAILDQPLPSSPLAWRNDPVAFDNYPSFFLAHEIAHQWWGQAVGWKNYHEQWLSEGFAQYFAALYAERERGADQFTSVIRQMRRWAIEMSPQGPVYLGYRLGHIKGDTRVFRAVVYNKGAMVLHMLRRFVGDRAFFAGLREFYTTERFRKAGTDDFQASMEAASGKSLQRFFDRWIFESDIPTVRFSVPETHQQRGARPLRTDGGSAVRHPDHGHAVVRGRIVGGRDGCRYRQGHRAQHPSEASAALGGREPGRCGARGDSQIDPGPDPGRGMRDPMRCGSRGPR